MYGYVLSYSVQTGEGAISGDDGQRYSFTGRDWMGSEVPRQGARIEFTPTDDRAASVYPVGLPQGVRAYGPSAFPAIAAGCGAGCATYVVLGLLLSIVVGIGLRGILSPDSGNGNARIVPMLIALVIGLVVGYLVYRAVRNRRR